MKILRDTQPLRKISLTILFLISALTFCVEPAHAEDELRVFNSISEIRKLHPTVAEEGHLVDVSATVLLYPGGRGPLVVTDGTAMWVSGGDYLETLAPTEIFAPRDVIRIIGHTNKGQGAPLIEPERITKIGKAELPPAMKVGIAEFDSGVLNSQWVTLEGVVQKTEKASYQGNPILNLTLAVTGGKTLVTLFLDSPQDDVPTTDSEIVATGVCLSVYNNRGDVLKSMLFASADGGIVETKAAPSDPFAEPLVLFSGLRNFSTVIRPNHRKRFLATVSSAIPGTSFHLIQGERGMKVYSQQDDLLSPGDMVECSGFFEIEDGHPVVREAIYRITGHESPPPPLNTTVGKILDAAKAQPGAAKPDMHARLVSLKGLITRIENRPDSGPLLYLDSGGRLIPVSVENPASKTSPFDLQRGSFAEVTGIANIFYSSDGLPWKYPKLAKMSLTLGSLADVRIIRQPSWWTAERLWGAVGIIGILLCLSFIWVGTLKKRVALRGAQLAEEIRSKRDAEVAFQAALRERERLAADLHDTLEQALTGVALQIHAIRTAKEPSKAERNLGIAERMLGRSREELRRNVWNLRTGDFEGRFLRADLYESCADMFGETGIRFDVGGSGVERPVNDFISGNLMLFGKEAVTNAVKHASATVVSVMVDYDDDRLRVTVSDNGSGFVTENVAGPHLGHFGLTGMRERARRIDGTIAINSIPGNGTTISIVVELEPAPSFLTEPQPAP